MRDESELLGLLDRIYAAGFGEASWDSVTVSVRDALACSVVALHVDDPLSGEGAVVSEIGLDPAAAELYESYYVQRNVWLHRAAPVVRTGSIFHGEDLVPQDELRRTEYYADFALPNGIDRALAVCLHHEPDLIAFFSLFRGPGDDGFSADDMALLRLLRPHLQRAASAGRSFQRLRGQTALAEDSLDVHPRGVAILDADGNVRFLNRRLERIIERDDGVVLDRTRLRFRGRHSDPLPRCLVGKGLHRSGGAFRVPRTSWRGAYEVLVVPLPGGRSVPAPFLGHADRPGWLVQVADPDDAPSPPATVLRRMYGLTQAQAEVASLLLEGRTAREIGEARRTTLNTTKSHVRMVYQKVGVSSRAAFVRRVAELARRHVDEPRDA